jgi:glycosyltransferase involved in cell wall biosynthesis
VGEVRDVGPLIDSSHIVITPSIEHEGLGLAAVEGLAHGRPVLATDVDGLSEIVDAQTGWILPCRRPQDWAELIRGIDGAAVAFRTRAARRRYEERFQLSRYEQEMLRLITDRH